MKNKTSPNQAKTAPKIESNSIVEGPGVAEETHPCVGDDAHVDTPELRSFLATKPDRELRAPHGSKSVSKTQLKLFKERPLVPLDQQMLEFARRITRPLDYGKPPLQSDDSTCNIGFNDPLSLQIIPDAAKFTFATLPFYIQNCGPGRWVNVMEDVRSQYGHYHLLYERGQFCITSSGQPGIMSGGSCVAIVDPVHEPRFVGSHAGDQWIRVYAYNDLRADIVFNLKEIKVTGNTGITLYFHRSTGEWRVWNRLPPGWWNLSEAASITEILIRGADGDLAAYFFDDIVVSVP